MLQRQTCGLRPAGAIAKRAGHYSHSYECNGARNACQVAKMDISLARSFLIAKQTFHRVRKQSFCYRIMCAQHTEWRNLLNICLVVRVHAAPLCTYPFISGLFIIFIFLQCGPSARSLLLVQCHTSRGQPARKKQDAVMKQQ